MADTLEQALAEYDEQIELYSANNIINDKLVIDSESRVIYIPGTEMLFGVESDEKAERKYFTCPRYVGDNIDLSTLNLRINYRNANGEQDVYYVEDVTVVGDSIEFTWLLSRKVTKYKGNIYFVVCAVKSDADGKVHNEWNTTLAQGIAIEGLEVNSEGIYDTDTFDIVEQLVNMLKDTTNDAKETIQEAEGVISTANQTIINANKAIADTEAATANANKASQQVFDKAYILTSEQSFVSQASITPSAHGKAILEEINGDTWQGANPSPDNPQPIYGVGEGNAVKIRTYNDTEEHKANIPVEYPLYKGDKIYRDKDKYYLYRENNRIVFDGSEDEEWEFHNHAYNRPPSKCYTILVKDCKKEYYTSLCSNFVNIQYAWRTEGAGAYSDNIENFVQYKFFVVDESLNTVEKFRTWLKANPITMVYKLETPTLTEINEEQLYNIISLEGTTNIEIEKNENLTSTNVIRFPRLKDGAIATTAYIDGKRHNIEYIDLYKQFDNVTNMYLGLSQDIPCGLRVDFTNGTYERLAGATGLTEGTDFDKFLIYGGCKRCNVDNDGNVLAWYGDTNYKEDGTNGQVMVYQPKVYYKVVPLVLEPKEDGYGYHMRKVEYFVSSQKIPGYKLHPAFYDENGNETDYIFYSAYEGSLFGISDQTYYLADEQVMTNTDGYMLSSISGAKPCSGKTQTLTRANIEKVAKNRGLGWHSDNIRAESLLQLLMVVEMANFNLQSKIGLGVVSIPDQPNTENNSLVTGGTSSLGNVTGMAEGTNGKVSITYRGKENPYGNIWKVVDGVNVYGNGSMSSGMAYISDDYNFKENINTNNYKPSGFTLPSASGYITCFGFKNEEFDWLMLPSETGSGGIVNDYCYVSVNLNDYRVAFLGGRWNDGASAGGFSWSVRNGSSGRNRNVGGRLVYIPSKHKKH